MTSFICNRILGIDEKNNPFFLCAPFSLPQLFRGLAVRTGSCLLDGEAPGGLPETPSALLARCPGHGGVLFTRRQLSPAETNTSVAILFDIQFGSEHGPELIDRLNEQLNNASSPLLSHPSLAINASVPVSYALTCPAGRFMTESSICAGCPPGRFSPDGTPCQRCALNKERTNIWTDLHLR